MATHNKFNRLNIDTASLGMGQGNSEKWKVYFDGGFWEHSRWQKAAKEIPTNIQFVLNDKVWHIPSVYTCSKGLVIDFCVQIPIESIRAFISKWNLSIENDGSDFTKEQQMQIEAENPMAINISSEIILNGKTIPYSHGSGLSWNPCFTQLNGIESEGVLKQYKLDPTSGWVIWRSAFPWSTTGKPEISSLSVIIKHDPIEISGLHFAVSTPGECIDFTHPITNVQHTMTVQEYKQEEMPAHLFKDTNYDYPTHCVVMSCTIHPDLADGSFSIRDYNDGDRPRKKQKNPNQPQGSADCISVGVISGAVGVIGGAGGPTAIAFGGKKQGKFRTACSALHFNPVPVDTVKWQIAFHEKPCADMTVKII